ncbi:hypothetical protein V3W47_18425 [Deinococcus sp. YIM 134068]|uniref:hypothetical protein n=1 Tax=Deinococcus lichenicola TaxID=3118910 RepID=UPI002F94C659
MPSLGHVLPDRKSALVFDLIPRTIASSIAARVRGEGHVWQKRFFSDKYAELNLKDEEVVFDILTSWRMGAGNVLEIWRCEACGRLWVQDWRTPNRLIAFQPEDEPVQDLFAVPEPEETVPEF